MMEQYETAKKSCGNAVLLFRMGDFYELFHEDAEIAAAKLGLTLTSRDKNTNAIPMAGFPHHQLDGYLAKLIQLGFRVAVCEQVESAKAAKGLVKRQVTRVVTPGTLTDPSLLDPRIANYLAAIYGPKNAKVKNGGQPEFGIAWIDLSTGIFQAATVDQKNLVDLLTRINPAEVLHCDDDEPPKSFFTEAPLFTARPLWCFGFEKSRSSLCHQFGTKNLEGFGLDDDDTLSIQAAGAVVEYLRETQKSDLDHVDRLMPFRTGQFLEIDQASWRSLEIAQTVRGQNRDGSLLGVIDRTLTPMGARKLGSWISQPLTDVRHIESRLDAVEEFAGADRMRNEIRSFLKKVFDVPRLLARVATGRASPRDIKNIGATLTELPNLKAKISGRKSQTIRQLEVDLDLCADLRTEIDAALIDTCPINVKDGGYIRSGFNEKLDELRALATGGKKWIAAYQAEITKSTGIPSLKVGFNKVFGYYLEVTHTHRDKVPVHFIRKQTLKNAERFITPELKEYEEKVLTADEQANELETELFETLKVFVRGYTQRLKNNADIVATLDVLSALADLSCEQNYCRPIVSQNLETKILDGRHPVLDIIEPLGTFVPNDCSINGEDGLIHLITGPNMAGKSTYIRQIALISIMAQMGSFVPARSTTIGIADKVFARIGASDELSRGQSTFMVEMNETARILNTATNKSLVILDEIGRGTSTYDGVSLAWAIVEYLHDEIGCRTLFATHYHELTQLEKSLQYVRNFNVTVKEWQNNIVFLHKIVPGAADKSYGIHVAQIAGVPAWVNSRAETILNRLESDNDSPTLTAGGLPDKNESGMQMTLFEMVDHPLLEKIKRLDPDHVTPIDALQLIGDWKQELAESTSPGKSK